MSNPPQGLYTARELLEGFSATDDLGFTKTHDFSVFRSFVMNGGAVPSTLMIRRDQAEHDASIGDGLRRFLKAQRKPLVGVMGGHGVARDSEAYADIARLTHHLSNKYLIVTGGGPGVMEAAHLGVAFSTSSEQKLRDALDRLARNPTFPGLDGVLNDNGEIVDSDAMRKNLIGARDWLQAAREARAMAPEDVPASLAIPTWLYGAEPTMPFATHYGKYFQNSIREEALISNSRAGIIYGQGGGGTLREVFQDVELNFYAKAPKDFTPMIFFSRSGFWEREAEIENQQVKKNGIKLDVVVLSILKAARYGIDKDDQKVKACLDKICFTHDHPVIDRILSTHADNARKNLVFALNAEPLKVTTSRINRV
jgi:predicted Rossmann-fold nucleotide-binding protein